jgi:hypothetical protein
MSEETFLFRKRLENFWLLLGNSYFGDKEKS